jgi:hypothetical protein
MYRYSDGLLRNYGSLRQDSYNFTSHAWLPDDRIIAGNSNGELFLIANNEISNFYIINDTKENKE